VYLGSGANASLPYKAETLYAYEVASFGNLKLPGFVRPGEAVDKMITTIDGLTLKDNEPPRAERRQGPIW
jgi:hypothetical protein